MKKTKAQAGKKGGTNRWKDVSKTERKKIMSERAKQLWVKIRAGKLSTVTLAKQK